MIPKLPFDAEQKYYKLISKIESNDDPKAKAKTSSASGRFQFVKSTWIGLGYDWADVFDDGKQWEAIQKLTAQNAAVLVKAGCAINFATLYGAHFLGVTGLLRVMRGTPGASITTVTNAAQRKANPTILNGTVKDFTDWLERKTGESYTKRYTVTFEPAPVEKQAPGAPVPKGGFNLGALVFTAVVVIAAAAVAVFQGIGS